MIPLTPVLAGVLLFAAPLFSSAPLADPVIANNEVQWFRLNETRADVARVLGLPGLVAAFGDDFESWQYRLDETEEEGYSHQLVFRKSTGRLVSVARNYFPERAVDNLLPQSGTSVFWYPNSGKREFSVRLRRLGDGLLLLGMGLSQPGQTTGQIFLIREEFLPVLFPWIQQATSSSR